ncbi:MAG: AbrB/MazE/SpoVT family DNA-binding domain-containing protein [Caldilineaceae bacterium]
MNTTPDITLEQPGIIRLSEALRQQLGLVPGMSLMVEAANGGIRLRVKERPAYLAYENHVLVFTGELIDKDTDFVEEDHEQRILVLMQ